MKKLKISFNFYSLKIPYLFLNYKPKTQDAYQILVIYQIVIISAKLSFEAKWPSLKKQRTKP